MKILTENILDELISKLNYTSGKTETFKDENLMKNLNYIHFLDDRIDLLHN